MPLLINRVRAQAALCTAVLSAAVAASVALGAEPAAALPDAFLTQLVGHWELVGTVQGKPAHYRGRGSWVLDGGWLHLELIDVARPLGYHAEVFLGFDSRQHDYIAHWLDKFGAAGARVVATGQRDGQTLVLQFPYAEGAFRDTLTLAADSSSGSLLLESQRADGSWSTFAAYTLRRRR